MNGWIIYFEKHCPELNKMYEMKEIDNKLILVRRRKDMRAKFRINYIERKYEGYEILYMCPVAASKYPADGSDENNTYAKFSPSGQMTLTIANPDLIGKFNENEEYYLDFTKVNK